jgi:hypothetical protein
MPTITYQHLCRNTDPTTAKVGDGCTILWYTDTQPATIISRTAKSLTVQVDAHKIESGEWPNFRYSYTPDPEGVVTKFHWSATKGWQARGTRLLVGDRRYYQDPTF